MPSERQVLLENAVERYKHTMEKVLAQTSQELVQSFLTEDKEGRRRLKGTYLSNFTLMMVINDLGNVSQKAFKRCLDEHARNKHSDFASLKFNTGMDQVQKFASQWAPIFMDFVLDSVIQDYTYLKFIELYP